MNASHKHNAQIMKALSHPIRYCIVDSLVDGEHRVTDMVDCLSIPQPTVSQHLNILKRAGIISARRHGNEIHYSVCSREAEKVVSALK
jgi:DNA-binding transcriptional ArsR family regulator